MAKSAVFVIDNNEISRNVLINYLKEFDFIENVVGYGDYFKALEDLKSEENAIVIIDKNNDIENFDEIIDKIKVFTSKFVITSNDYSTNTIVKALRLGAKDFLPKPVLKDDLSKILFKLSNLKDEEEKSNSKIVTVYSNKGGIGKTTIAVNLASELAKVTKDKVALIDLNLQLGDVSTFLNINPTFDVSYVIRRLIDKDENIVVQGFEKYKEQSLYVLSDPEFIEQAESITPNQIGELFDVLRKVFPYIVIDMSSNIDSIALKILDESDWVMFTTIVTLPAIRNAQRCLNLFQSRKYSSDKVKVILNRYMDNDDIRINDIENTLGRKIYWKIPNNYFTIMEAINKGVTISEINSESNIGNSFRDFATKVSDDIIEQDLASIKV